MSGAQQQDNVLASLMIIIRNVNHLQASPSDIAVSRLENDLSKKMESIKNSSYDKENRQREREEV